MISPKGEKRFADANGAAAARGMSRPTPIVLSELRDHEWIEVGLRRWCMT